MTLNKPSKVITFTANFDTSANKLWYSI